ncbi:MAG: cyanoexosortase B system-associated protein [Leptolyngbya sp. SIO1E4]|nr:cyanoexosortase B system-associated protein [Leptolyngbya sp. SIO1E4]
MSEAVKPISRGKQFVQWGLIAVLAAIIAIATLPHYVSGQWPWSAPPKVPQINQLRTLIETPLVLPGWERTFHQEVSISGNSWSLAEYHMAEGDSADQTSSFALLLRPQPWHDDKPGVEWVDLVGAQGWQVNDLHHLRFSVTDSNDAALQLTTRYFRGLGEDATFAVMQWYAWPTGGHPSPGKWFWADQMRQWSQRERMPWVAVSLLLPIEPVGDIRPYSETAIAIGQAVQTSLMQSAFSKI